VDDASLPIIVIGAGIVGVSTAIELQRDGADVILIDRADPGEGASWGNGGVLASCSIVPVPVPGLLRKAQGMLLDRDAPLFLRWSHLPRAAPWLRRHLGHATADQAERTARALLPIIGDSLADHQALASGTPAERWIRPCDYTFVYPDRAAFQDDAFAWNIRRDNGFAWDEIEGPALRAYAPALSETAAGFAARLEGHGRVTDPGRYVKDLAADFKASGGRVVKADVTGFATSGNRVTGIRAGGETLPCAAAVLTTGAWSEHLARALGVDVRIESERGYHIELWEPNLTFDAALMISSGKFVVTPMDGRIRLAGIVEFGGLEAPPSRGPFGLLRRATARTMPGLTWKRETEWMGHRPTTVDSIPLIGPAPKPQGVWLGFGHHHVGLTGGPKTGRILARMIAGRVPNMDLTPYAPRAASGV
jgi:D-amino-acid dehydrogenase